MAYLLEETGKQILIGEIHTLIDAAKLPITYAANLYDFSYQELADYKRDLEQEQEIHNFHQL